MEKEFRQEFKNDYEKFIREFDEVAKDALQGYKLEELSKQFLNKHKKEFDSSMFLMKSKYPNCTNLETINEDLNIMTNENKLKNVTEYHKTLANLYRRFCQATHLRVTFNKSRLDQEDDRTESVYYGRLAIRHNPDDFQACCWYMCSLGWLLNAIKGIKDRTVVGRLYRDSCLRCIRLDPKDFLPHNLLGRYYYHVAELTWIERKIAKSFLGADNLDNTFTHAQQEFQISHELKDFLPTCLWMARVLIAQKRPYDDILKWINYGLQVECNEPTSEIDKRTLIELDLKLRQRNN